MYLYLCTDKDFDKLKADLLKDFAEKHASYQKVVYPAHFELKRAFSARDHSLH